MVGRRGTSRAKTTDIDVVETAYRAAGAAPEAWLENVLPTVAPMLDRGGTVFAYEYDTSRPYDDWLSLPLAVDAAPGYADGVVATFASTPLIRAA